MADKDNLSIEKFVPQKAELIQLAKKYESLTINGIDDKTGYKIVDEARKDLKKKRIQITNTGKDLRSEALKFQKAVIGLENELTGLIEPVEKHLQKLQDDIDDRKAKMERLVLLPERREKLEKINVDITDEEILAMNPEMFTEYYNEMHGRYLEEKERKLKEEQEAIDREKEEKKRAEEEKRQAKEAKKRAEEEAKEREKKIREEAEEEKRKAVLEAEKKAEREKQALIDEQKKKEQEREEKEAREEAEKKRIKLEEEAKQKEIEAQKNYIEFLKANGCTKETKDEFYIMKGEGQIILYKKIAIYNL